MKGAAVSMSRDFVWVVETATKVTATLLNSLVQLFLLDDILVFD
jgi:hypothetical protein